MAITAASQVDALRSNLLNVNDFALAKESWKEAETALSKALGLKKAAEKEAPAIRLARRGESCKVRKEASIAKLTNSQTSSPRQRNVVKASRSRPNTIQVSRPGENNDEVSSNYDTGSPNAEASVRARSKLEATSKRTNLWREKAEQAVEAQSENGKRRLRAKIADVLLEVRKRQELHEQQERAKKFREHRFSRGIAPQPALGDTTQYALGLPLLEDAEEYVIPTATKTALLMKTALLDSLTLQELDLVRKSPEWFFSGPAVEKAAPPEQGLSTNEKSRSTGLLSSLGNSFTSNSASMAGDTTKGARNNSNLWEDVIDFFSVHEQDRNLEVSVYAKNLRTQLVIIAGRRQQPGVTETVDYRKTLCRDEAEEPSPKRKQIVDDVPPPPIEMMPCCGRRPHVRADQESPTLLKVREVYNRRDEQDARWVEDRREAIARRLELNAFKAREQQRELALQVFKQKELHKVRMLQAEEKKSLLEAENRERTELLNIQKIHRLLAANERADNLVEEKREQVSSSLEDWHGRVIQASHQIRKADWERRREGDRRHQRYMERLNAIGESRQDTAATVSQAQKNDELKTRIQTSLSGQLAESRHQESIARAELIKAKQEAAAARRQKHLLGNRFGFIEQAFGSNAVGFDAKSHMVAVDRRQDPWRRSAESWSKMRGSFSMPDIPPARPMSPGGDLEKSLFKIDTVASSG